jgi:hypothetical protein
VRAERTAWDCHPYQSRADGTGVPSLPKALSLANRCRFLALAATEIIEFRAARAPVLFHFHFCDARRMQRKNPFDALAVRDAAHGESFVDPATFPADHNAGKDLDSFLVSFHNSRVHPDAVANRKRFGIAFLLFFLNGIDDLIHKLVASRAAAGAHSHSKALFLQPEIANLFKHEREAQAAARQHQKIL